MPMRKPHIRKIKRHGNIKVVHVKGGPVKRPRTK